MIKGMRRLLSYARRAVDDYDMIAEGDKIAVGVSAGKDSLSLLYTLAELRRFYPKRFELVALTVDMRFNELSGGTPSDFSPIAELCASLDVEYHVEPSNIAKIVFDIRHESNPCSLCAKMRRGALNDAIRARGISKLALGHHFDDAVETFLMSLLFEGRIGCFEPVTYLSRSGVTQIRPMLYIGEKAIEHFAQAQQLPVVRNVCPADKHTKRQEIKELIASLQTQYPDIKTRIFGAMQRYPLSQWSVQK